MRRKKSFKSTIPDGVVDAIRHGFEAISQIQNKEKNKTSSSSEHTTTCAAARDGHNSIHQSPIRSYMSASTLRSNKWNRPSEANAILDDRHHGRSRILIIQLQGHIFFGIVPQLTEAIGAAIQDLFIGLVSLERCI